MTTSAKSGTRAAQMLHHVTLEAYSRESERLVFALNLPPVTEKWVRALVRRPTGRMKGMHPLDKTQVAKIQPLMELVLEPSRFIYHLDGGSVVKEIRDRARVHRKASGNLA